MRTNTQQIEAVASAVAAKMDDRRKVLAEAEAVRPDFDAFRAGVTRRLFDAFTSAYAVGAWYALPESMRANADRPVANDFLRWFGGLPTDTTEKDMRLKSLINASDYIRNRCTFALQAKGQTKPRKPKAQTVDAVTAYVTRALNKVKPRKAEPTAVAALLKVVTDYANAVKAAHAGTDKVPTLRTGTTG